MTDWFKSSDLDQKHHSLQTVEKQSEDCSDTSPIRRGELNYSTKITSTNLSVNPA
jgi:hypothetical protein